MAYDSLRILEPKNKSFNLYSLVTFSKNFFLKNPYESELPPQFLLLKLYQYILIGVGVIFGYLFLKYLKNYGR